MSDLISRQAAIDAFEKELSAKYNRLELAIGFVGVKSILEKMPSAEPERKTGRWKHYGKETWLRDDGKSVFLQCSECNAVVMNNGSAVWNYCPDCGARMEAKDG